MGNIDDMDMARWVKRSRCALGYGDPVVLNTGCDKVHVAEPQGGQGLPPQE